MGSHTNECDVNTTWCKGATLRSPAKAVLSDPCVEVVLRLLRETKVGRSDTLKNVVVVLRRTEDAGLNGIVSMNTIKLERVLTDGFGTYLNKSSQQRPIHPDRVMKGQRKNVGRRECAVGEYVGYERTNDLPRRVDV